MSDPNTTRRRLLCAAPGLACLGLLAPARALAETAADAPWMKHIANFRGMDKPFGFSMKVIWKKGDNIEENSADVYFHSHQQVLVLFRSPASVVGRRILIDGEAMWLGLPSSQRVLRILPSQRLLGEASNGDIVNTDFSKYRLALKNWADYQGKKTIHLRLEAIAPDMAYQRIDYYVDPANHRPSASEHYAASGKLLKTIKYVEFQRTGNGEKLRTLQIVNNLLADQVTEMIFERYAPQNIPIGSYLKANLLNLNI
ncbi:MAG: outer membrane lipoprotein-sorting protein [Azoarcus sp.]|jgi:hypothetical protein|nr:outer membrane lipoprotein-sorting protein [Azoarcus sp.]